MDKLVGFDSSRFSYGRDPYSSPPVRSTIFSSFFDTRDLRLYIKFLEKNYLFLV